MKSIKMFGKSVPLLAIVVISMLVVGASAGLLAFYGKVITTSTVTQSVTIAPGSNTLTTWIAGNTYCFDHVIENIAEVPAEVELETSYSTNWVLGDIVTSYYKPVVDYSYSQSYAPSILGESIFGTDLAVTVEDTGAGWLTWTYTYAPNPTHTPKMTVAIDYDTGFAITTLDDDSGGWFYAPDPDVVTNRVRIADYDGSNQISGYDWVDVSAVGSVLTVSIKKSALDDSFHWHGFANYNGNQVWIGPEGALYGAPYINAIIRDPLTGPFTVPAEGKVNLQICYKFAIALKPDTYKITTTVLPK